MIQKENKNTATLLKWEQLQAFYVRVQQRLQHIVKGNKRPTHTHTQAQLNVCNIRLRAPPENVLGLDRGKRVEGSSE